MYSQLALSVLAISNAVATYAEGAPEVLGGPRGAIRQGRRGVPSARIEHQVCWYNAVGVRYMVGCQNYGPFWGPYYNTAPNI